MVPSRIADALVADLARLRFSAPVAVVYNPLVYARRSYDAYLRRYGQGRREVVMVGMNPGPWGMAQTGVPFGEVNAVRDWLGICEHVDKPAGEHPKRPVLGMACRRSEVSGRRLWGWARDTFGTPERFFARFFIANYCPLAFMEASGRNLTPDKLPARQRHRLLEICDRGLRRTIEYFEPRWVVSIGTFAESRATCALAGMPVSIIRILHPSPASPASNNGWREHVTAHLRDRGILLE